MTTAVTIDAHAGWPVKVTYFQKEVGQNSETWQESRSEAVAKGTQRTVHIHSSQKIQVEELRMDAVDD